MGRSEIYNINGRENKPRSAACIAKTMEVPTIVVIAFSLHYSLTLSLSLFLPLQHTYVYYTYMYINTRVSIHIYTRYIIMHIISRRSRASAPRPHCRQLNDTRRRPDDDVHPLHSHAHNDILLLCSCVAIISHRVILHIRAVFHATHIDTNI